MSDWFEVVERWTDARGERECIIFCGQYDECVKAAASYDRPDDLTIRPISF